MLFNTQTARSFAKDMSSTLNKVGCRMAQMKKPVRPPDGDEAEFCDTTPPHAIPRTRARAPADDWPDDYLEQFDADYPHKVGMAAALTALTSKRR